MWPPLSPQCLSGRCSSSRGETLSAYVDMPSQPTNIVQNRVDRQCKGGLGLLSKQLLMCTKSALSVSRNLHCTSHQLLVFNKLDCVKLRQMVLLVNLPLKSFSSNWSFVQLYWMWDYKRLWSNPNEIIRLHRFWFDLSLVKWVMT